MSEHALGKWLGNLRDGRPPGRIPDGLAAAVRQKLEAVCIVFDERGTEAAITACERLGLRAETEDAGDDDGVDAVWRPSAHTDEPHATDLGNARRLVDRHGKRFRFCKGLGGWIQWDGKRWTLDSDGQIERAAKETVHAIYAKAPAIGDRESREHAVRWALRSESAAKLDAMVKVARSDAEVVANVDAFDNDPWLLNVENGTIDLRSGHLRPHDPADHITRLAPVRYVPGATSPMLTRFLADATNDDHEFQRYLQQAAGYTLVGLTSEEVVLMLVGPGGSGKSTFVEMMLAALGDYGVKAAFSTFLASRGGGRGGEARPDLVAMRGARLVVAAEPTRGRGIDAGLLKELSGGDSITARALYASLMTFVPSFTIWLAANAAPTMPDDDTGLWRRLKTLPFEHAVPEANQDPAVKEHLTRTPEGRAAVLAWAVEGCLAWQSLGRLKAPQAVIGATADLRIQFDPLAEFFDERCEFESSSETPAKQLRAAYEAWAGAQGAKPIRNQDWGKRLLSRGCERHRPHTAADRVTVWRGVRLL
jgi:putative DNA primase/helicase